MKNVCKHSYTDIVCKYTQYAFYSRCNFRWLFSFYLNFPKEKGLAAQ